MLNFRKTAIFPLVLVLILLIETFNYANNPPGKGLLAIRESIGSIVKQRWSIFLVPKNNIDSELLLFANEIEVDLSSGSKILFIKDTNDGTDLRRYFMFNYLLSGRTDASYNFEKNPAVPRIIEIMKETHSSYLVTYATILPTYKLLESDSTMARGKLFRLDDGQLKLVREYN